MEGSEEPRPHGNDLLFMLSVPLDGVLRCGKVESVRCAT